MTKMKHAQLAAQRKIKTSELDDLEAKFDNSPVPKSFRKHEGQNVQLHKMALADPAQFYHCVKRGYSNKKLEYQAWQLTLQVKHITIPRRRPEDWRAAYEINPKTNQIKSLRIITKSEINKFYPKYLSAKHLDLSLVSNPGPGNDRACQVMVDFLRKEFLPKGPLSDSDYREFFVDEKHYNINCRENHLPKVPRVVLFERAAPKQLINGYSWDDL